MSIVYYFIGFNGNYIHSKGGTVDGEAFLLRGIGRDLLRFPSLPQGLTFLEEHRHEYVNGDKLDVYRAEITVAHTLGVRA